LISLSGKTAEKVSRMETRPYPGSRYQHIVSAILLILSASLFSTSSMADFPLNAAFFLIFSSLTLSVAIFPQYQEFSAMRGDLVKNGVAKSRIGKGLSRFMPLVALLVVLILAPVVLILVAPPGLFLGAVTGMIAGFAGFQLVFTLYVSRWGRARGLRLSRYSLYSEDGEGKRLVVEYGLRAEGV
jgi:membrane protein implicated in regulation of membrane protease activity